MINYAIAKIAGATPAETFTGRDGAQVTKCNIIFKTIEGYPQTLALQAFGDLTAWAGSKDAVVEVGYTASCHEHEGRWYAELRLTSIKTASIM